MTHPNENGPKAEDSEAGEAKVGQTLQRTRLSAHIETNKICADLRISPQSLEALEQGNYHLLPGDPYIRALLGSMSRYLGLDPAAIVKAYNKEIGATPQAPSIAPYTDKATKYSNSHKQIFVIIVLALFVVLFLLIGKLNRGESIPALPATGTMAPVDSIAIPGDSATESKYLAPDTLAATAESLKDASKARPPTESAVPPPGTVPIGPSASPTVPALPPGAQGPLPAGSTADTAGMNIAVIKPLVDSVGVRVVRSGKEDFATLLRFGKQMQVSHPDTIIVYTSKRGTVEVTVGGHTVTPTRKRFKIYGNTVKAF